jgi:hypothetical protein
LNQQGVPWQAVRVRNYSKGSAAKALERLADEVSKDTKYQNELAKETKGLIEFADRSQPAKARYTYALNSSTINSAGLFFKKASDESTGPAKEPSFPALEKAVDKCTQLELIKPPTPPKAASSSSTTR